MALQNGTELAGEAIGATQQHDEEEEDVLLMEAGGRSQKPELGKVVNIVVEASRPPDVLPSKAREDKDPASGVLPDMLKLSVFVLLWYFFNVQYNLENKRLLQVFPATWAISFLQLFAGIPVSLLMWACGAMKIPRLSRDDVVKLLPVAVAFAVGQVATVASLSSVAVSFTHVVKALEPAVNAVVSAIVLGQVFHPIVYCTLLPIAFGVSLASSHEISFTMFGFLCAMASNIAFASRNVLATKFKTLGDMGEGQIERKSNQLSVLTIMATAIVFPVAVGLPGGLMSIPAAIEAAKAKDVSGTRLAYLMATSGFYFFMYQLSSFWVLSQVRPITHSVLNTMKRVVVIISAVVVFHNQVSQQSIFGTVLAILGILAYIMAKSRLNPKD